jgi:hypothetical protein
MPLHPAYAEAAMPADHAAAATAYLVAVLTDEYHGEQVTRYTVLERAGFIQATAPAAPTLPGPLQAGPSRSSDRVETFRRGSLLVEQLQKVLAERLSTDALRLKSLFEKLVIYYQEAPAELARFTKDAALIDEANRFSNERVTLILTLMAALTN